MKETKFKQTEVGMIPSDWEVFELSQLYDITSSKRVFQKDWTSAGVPFYRAREIAVMSAGKTPEDDLFITKEMFDAYTTQYGKIRENDVLITGVGTLGKVYVVKAKDEFYFKDGNIIWLQWKRKNSSLLLKLFFETNIVIDQIFGNSGGSTVATYTISNAKKTKIPLPPTIEEQQRIANALSDVDTLIANLEKLIAKKKNIKQGAIQQLLTGKKRLPGFGSDERQKECHSKRNAKREVEESSGYKMTELGLIPTDWEVKTISQVGKIIGGGTPSTFNSAYWNGSVQWFTPAELSKAGKYVSKSERTITKLGVENCSAKILPAGTILLTTRASIGTSAILKAPACTNQGFQSLVVNSENSNEFLYYLLSTKVDEMMSLASGSTFLEISPKKLGGIQLQIPSSRAEQTAIANVLSDMDTEIDALEQKLAKMRKIKQGMMQELLTGKIRLV